MTILGNKYKHKRMYLLDMFILVLNIVSVCNMMSGICWGEEEVSRSIDTNGHVFEIVVAGWWVQEVHYTVSFYSCICLKVYTVKTKKTKQQQKNPTKKQTHTQKKPNNLDIELSKLPSSNLPPDGTSKTIDSCWCCQNVMQFRFPALQVCPTASLREQQTLLMSSQQCGKLQQDRSHTIHL